MPEPIDPAARVGQLDETVERLTSEITSLKLELTTLISAVQEIQVQQLGRRVHAGARVVHTPAPAPSSVPAAAIVLIAVGLLSWQLIVTPTRADRAPLQASAVNKLSRASQSGLVALAAPVRLAAPVAPAAPVIYRGTLSVRADQPSATVFVNRQPVGTAPVRVRNLRAGSHLVWIESEGHRRWTRVITVPAERVTQVSADLEPVQDDR